MRIATIERLAAGMKKLTGAEAYGEAETLKQRFQAALQRSNALKDFVLAVGPAAQMVDDESEPLFVFTYTKAYSSRYVAELSFVLEKGRVQAHSRILRTTTVGEQTHVSCESESEVRFHCLEGLAKLAVKLSLEQRVALMQDLGFSVTPPTMKKLVKTAGHVSF